MGDNPGTLQAGQGQNWVYAGQAGETLTITTIAEWDTTLALLRDGEELAFNDDADGLPNFNSRIIFTLPADGTYVIAVRSFQDQSGGDYTLNIASSPSAAR